MKRVVFLPSLQVLGVDFPCAQSLNAFFLQSELHCHNDTAMRFGKKSQLALPSDIVGSTL